MISDRTLIILAVLVVLYIWWQRKKAKTISATGEWANYAPTRFRVVDGGGSIVGVDDK